MTENGNMYMPVAPAYNAGSGFGSGFGSDFWLILILLFCFGGWGNGGFGGGAWGMDGLYPWMNNAQITTNGFQNQALGTAISGLQNSITSGFGDVQLGIAGVNQNICQTGNGITQAVTNGFAQAEIADNARQMASMQQLFGLQTGLSNQLNNISMAQQNCCCENRAAIADVKYAIATENCADRAAVSDGVRDIMAQQTANTQALVNSTNAGFQGLMDKICQLELDAKNDKIADLQNKLTMANLAASQNAQTAAIIANNEAQTSALENYLNPPARPAYIVQNPNCCAQNYYSGCGCGLN